MAILCWKCIQIILFIAWFVFLLHFGITKSRFHYFICPKPSFAWFWDFWTCPEPPKPTSFIFGETRIPEKIKKNTGTFSKYEFCKSENQKNEKQCRKCVHCFLLLTFWIPHLYHVLWRWGPENDEDWFNKIYRSLDMHFISIKKHEMELLSFWDLST